MKQLFETERLIVRPFTSDDKENFFALNGSAEVMKYIRPAKTKEECDHVLQETILDAAPHPFKGRWAVDEKATGLFVGSFAIIPVPGDEENTQMGYSFIPSQWGKGFGTEVARGGVQYFLEKTPLDEIYGLTETPHIASQKVLLKNGFQFLEKRMDKEIELLVFILKRS